MKADSISTLDYNVSNIFHPLSSKIWKLPKMANFQSFSYNFKSRPHFFQDQRQIYKTVFLIQIFVPLFFCRIVSKVLLVLTKNGKNQIQRHILHNSFSRYVGIGKKWCETKVKYTILFKYSRKHEGHENFY
jgi:hypothetical protein